MTSKTFQVYLRENENSRIVDMTFDQMATLKKSISQDQLLTDADFYIQTKGTKDTVGNVHPKILANQWQNFVAVYVKPEIKQKINLQLIMSDIHHSGHWKMEALGTLNLQHIRIEAIRKIKPLQLIATALSSKPNKSKFEAKLDMIMKKYNVTRRNKDDDPTVDKLISLGIYFFANRTNAGSDGKFVKMHLKYYMDNGVLDTKEQVNVKKYFY